jgi:hypothetical protein
MVLAVSLVPLAAAVLVSCTDDGEPTTQPAAFESATPAAAVTAIPTTAIATPRPDALRPPTGVAMIDVASGNVLPLFEGEGFANTGGFEADGTVWVSVFPPLNAPFTWYVFDATGKRLSDPSAGTPPVSCYPLSGASGCGLPSPGGKHILYFVDIDRPDVRMGRYAAWLLDIATGSTRELTDQLRHCGGCDGVAGPEWSPSGRYVLFGETYSGPDSTAYLADAETGTVRSIGKGPSMFGLVMHPRWSPADDSFIARSNAGGSILERLESGTAVRFLDVSWPAAFDESGQYIYSLGRFGAPQEGMRTAIASVASGRVVETWSGQGTNWPITRGGAAYRGTPIALLEQADGCTSGTVAHHPLIANGERCIHDARGAVWSPSFDAIAIARSITAPDGAATLTATPAKPLSAPRSGAVWAILYIDVATGREVELAGGFPAADRYPPMIRWSPDGARLLVSWPWPSGI